VKRDGAWKVTALVSTQQKDGLTMPLMTPITVEKTEIGDAPKIDGDGALEAAAGGEVITSLTMGDSAPASSGGATEAPAPKGEAEAATAATPATPVEGQSPAEATEPVVILATTAGEITIRLFEKDAPETVKNFLEHTKEKRYDQTYFHRVFAGKMIQGGDFNTRNDNRDDDGKGGYSYKGVGTRLKFEKNTRTHQRGSVSMAHGKELDSAGSQFFIMLAPAKSYDGQYCVFGEVISGIEVVDAISKMPGKELKNGGVNPDVQQRITAGRVESWTVSKIESTRAEKNM
jgi:peptidyl-prolyl cis-trans isomerase B (cyclophilin B)